MKNRKTRAIAMFGLLCLALVLTASPSAAAQGNGNGNGNGSSNGNGGGNNLPGLSATPELDSLALFGAGAAGMVGYALMRLRAARRQDKNID